ncbi:MAG: alkyl hydroperoxide reductase subunit F [Proteobacteria bacterium SG_bin7]|nr:MAG: alkyl hydroperoxide reductase subunit F [Proteobacteria bacterium SG_bin7]
MLDIAIIEQLRDHFSKLSQTISLRYDESSHSNQGELVRMLSSVAELSPMIQLQKSGKTSEVPAFEIFRSDQPTGISFRGIPGGHEFTSLVLAILNADGKGRFPEPYIVNRIKNLKGSIRLKTYVSLSCDNCPEVVQALNQMVLLHSDFQHQMVDGTYAQSEIEDLNIQGVPAVFSGDKMLHSGKAMMMDLLTSLELHYGTNSISTAQSLDEDLGWFDVVVLGGGPAGASAAIYSARKGLKTAVLAERIGGQVQETKGIENLISVPYTEGPQLSAQIAKHMAEYPIKIFEQRRVRTVKSENGEKFLQLEGGGHLKTQALVIATGAKWRELCVPGEKEYIGRGVAYCPHCDGPFYKGKKVAVIGGGNSGVEAAIDLAGIVGHVTLFEFQPQLKADQILVDKLKSLTNVKVITNAKTHQIVGNGQKVVGIEYEDRLTAAKIKYDLDGIFIQIGLVPNSAFVKGVVELTPFGEIIVDNKGRTSVAGIYAAGDVTTTPFKQIIIAMGEGAKAALTAFEDRMYRA